MITHHQWVYHPNPPVSHPGGLNLLQRMEMDQYAPIRNSENIYFPFASRSEWELADWLSRGALSHKEIDTYLHLEHMIYGEFMSADDAWRIQDELLDGHSFLGVIGASDKTPLTIGTGNKEMHPLLLSLANIHAGVRMKATSHAFALATYLPIPKFRNITLAVQAVLSAHIYHFAISIVMWNLIIANHDSKEMSDPLGNRQTMHTPLIAWIADYPEQLMIACVSAKNSPISLATSEQFGDAVAACDPCNIASFHKVCLTKHLNGIVEPFWAIWGDACPSHFLTPEALHQWHKFYFDHCVHWVTNIIGGTGQMASPPSDSAPAENTVS
ncbi:hypothetical protein EDC04DRAFT_2871434 [Pisolithus marmoratus]|nr:hypothetical protein EDC04DRAFT_2871434 [Pisolithus marmoratus]